MALARWQSTIVDDEGNVVPSASIEVRREIAGAPLASLYSDRNGATPIGNPFTADADGFAAFHVVGGAYRIMATSGSFSQTWRYVGVGTNSESDFGTQFLPSGAWDNGTTYGLGAVVSHSVGGGDPYAFVSNHAANLGNEPDFDSGGTPLSDTHWTVLGLIEAPGEPGAPGASDVVGTSTTSLAIATGSKVFTIVESDRGWGVGVRLRASSDANPDTHYMEGVVTDYVGTSLTLLVDHVAGSGTRADWTINVAGDVGGKGDQGDTGEGSRIIVQNDEPATAFPDGSLWIDANSANLDVYELTGSPLAWVDTGINLKGTQGDPGDPGEDGVNPAVFVQDNAPSTDNPEGSLWIDANSTDNDLYQLTGSPLSWVDTGVNLRGAAGAGSGDVVGPDGGVVDSEITLFDGTSGKQIKGSGVGVRRPCYRCPRCHRRCRTT